MEPRFPRYSIALISAAALSYEILLMRLFSIIQWHHFAYMIISLALLGYGVSGTFISLVREWLLRRFPQVFVANLLLFGVSAVACFLAAQRITFNPEQLLWDLQQPLWLMFIYLLLMLPFFFAANAVGLAISRFHQQAAPIYGADLLGAGLGSLAIIGLLFLFFPERILQLLGVLGGVAALLACWELDFRFRNYWFLPSVVMLISLLLPYSWLAPVISPYKGLSQMLRIKGVEVVDQYTSPLGLLSVIKSSEVPLRHAPGLSLNATTEPPQQLGVFTDGDAMTVLTQGALEREQFTYLDQQTSALPYHLKKAERVLVLGAGGGADVLQALYHQVRAIDAVELNAQMVQLVTQRYKEFTNNLYTNPGVQVHVAEARSFVANSDKQYDVIQLVLMDSFNASSAGLYALNESYLYTVEALQAYLDHLTPDGYLVISRWVKLPPRDMLKLFSTAVTALRNRGIEDPAQRLVMIRSWQTSTLLIKNGNISAEEIMTLRRFSQKRSFDVAFYPGMNRDEANHYNQLQQPYFFTSAQALLSGSAAEYHQRYKFNIKPATDDQPYFFHFFKWGQIKEIWNLRGQGGFPLLEWGYLILVATLIQALLAGALLILLPLYFCRGQLQGSLIRPWRVFIYFGSIGLAFLFLEMAFMQKFTLFLSHPLYAMAVVICSFLLFAGIGSICSRYLIKMWGALKVMKVAVVVICLLGGLFLLLPKVLFPLLLQLPELIKIIFAILLIAPLAFFMGIPFPLALVQLGSDEPALIPWAWGVNGCASVVSAVLATLLAIHVGFSLVVLAALVLYLLAFIVFRKCCV